MIIYNYCLLLSSLPLLIYVIVYSIIWWKKKKTTTKKMCSDPSAGITFVADPKKPVGGHVLAHGNN